MSGLAGPLSAGAGTAPDYTAVPRPAAGEEPPVLILGAGVGGLTAGLPTGQARPPVLGAEVTFVDLTRAGVRVGYRSGGQERTTTADHCVSNIPPPVLKQLELTGFSP